jgi:hypothetical protein
MTRGGWWAGRSSLWVGSGSGERRNEDPEALVFVWMTARRSWFRAHGWHRCGCASR